MLCVYVCVCVRVVNQNVQNQRPSTHTHVKEEKGGKKKKRKVEIGESGSSLDLCTTGAAPFGSVKVLLKDEVSNEEQHQHNKAHPNTTKNKDNSFFPPFAL